MHILGREAGYDDETVGAGQRLEDVEDEAGGPGDQGIEPFDERPGPAGIDRVIPELGAEPGAAGWPQSPLGAVDRTGGAPEVGVVMQHPATGAVVLARHDPAALAQVLNHRDQRLEALGKIGRSGSQ